MYSSESKAIPGVEIVTDKVQELNGVSIKAPPFMENHMEGWFTIMEAQFHLQKISVESTKYFHVIAALPPNIVCKISTATLDSQLYSKLKEEVIQLLERSKAELFEELIGSTAMAGRPSVYLSELLSRARKVGVTEDLVRHKFTQALPTALGPVLAAQKSTPLEQLGKLADELMSLISSPCMAVPAAQSVPVYRRDHNAENRPGTARQQWGLQPFHADQRPKVCRGHIFFGAAARSCKPWCQWPRKSSNLVIQPSSRASSPSPATRSRPSSPEN